MDDIDKASVPVQFFRVASAVPGSTLLNAIAVQDYFS